jgi:hypothetical protein
MGKQRIFVDLIKAAGQGVRSRMRQRSAQSSPCQFCPLLRPSPRRSKPDQNGANELLEQHQHIEQRELQEVRQGRHQSHAHIVPLGLNHHHRGRGPYSPQVPHGVVVLWKQGVVGVDFPKGVDRFCRMVIYDLYGALEEVVCPKAARNDGGDGGSHSV